MNNVEIFDKYIEEKKLAMLKGTNVEGITHYSFPETIEVNGETKKVLGGGAVRRALIAIRNDQSIVDIYCFNIMPVPEDIDLYRLYTVLNELNTAYKFITFYEANDIINAKSSIPLIPGRSTFDPELAFQILSIMFKAVNDEYNRIASTLKKPNLEATVSEMIAKDKKSQSTSDEQK